MKHKSNAQKSPPLILVSPNIEKKGDEFGDMSTSLSETYQKALMSVGSIPLTLPASMSRALIAACVSRCDGVVLTGGEDIDPRIYADGQLPPRLRRFADQYPRPRLKPRHRNDLRMLRSTHET